MTLCLWLLGTSQTPISVNDEATVDAGGYVYIYAK